MKGCFKEAKILNQYLKALEQQVYDTYRQMIESNIPITAELLRDKVTGKNAATKSRTLVSVFQEHNTRMSLLVGKEYAKGTLARYETSLSHTIEFIQWQYDKNDIDISKH